MLHYSPGGAVPKGYTSDLFSTVKASLLQLEYCLQELTDILIAKNKTSFSDIILPWQLLTSLLYVLAVFCVCIIHMKIGIFYFIAS